MLPARCFGVSTGIVQLTWSARIDRPSLEKPSIFVVIIRPFQGQRKYCGTANSPHITVQRSSSLLRPSAPPRVRIRFDQRKPLMTEW